MCTNAKKQNKIDAAYATLESTNYKGTFWINTSYRIEWKRNYGFKYFSIEI